MIVATQQEVLNLEKIAIKREFGFEHTQNEEFFEVVLNLKN